MQSKKVDQIYFALLQELLTTIHTIGTLNWCQQFWYSLCASLLHAQLMVHDLMDGGFLECPIRKLRDEQGFVDHAFRSVLRLQRFHR